MWLKVAVRNSFSIFSRNHMETTKCSSFSGSQKLKMIWKPGCSGQLYHSISPISSMSVLLSPAPSPRVGRVRALSPSSSLPSTIKMEGTKFAFSTSSVFSSSSTRDGGFNSIDNSQTICISKEGLKSKEQVDSFLHVLSEEQRTLLYQSLHLEVLRNKYMNELGSESHWNESNTHYLSKFGRPATSPTADATGSLSEVSPKWLHTKLELNTEHVPLPDEEKLRPVQAADLWAVGLKNALPFVGFGFLDNLIMILAGDYIDLTIGATLSISTMAAAALGNTISDVAGIASAWYVEFFAEKIGIRDPIMTAAQQMSTPVRWCTNIGRAVGVIIGCLLGMVPLLFLPSAEVKAERKAQEAAATAANSKKTEESSPN